MLRKTIISLLILPMAAILSSCSSEDVITDSVKTENLTLTVSQENFAGLDSMKTRTIDSGTSTTFASGDAIGIYVVNGSTVTNANLKYTYNGSSWSNTTYGTSVPFVAGGKYFAYYPYKDTYDASSVTPSATTAEAFFATVISGWTPDANQSTHDLYTAQDLMISLGTASSSGYSFSMAHKMALVEVDLAQVNWTYYSSTVTSPKYTFTTYTPYNISNGAYRILVKPATTYTIQGSIYTGRSLTNTWNFTTGTTLTAGTYKPYKINGIAASLTSSSASPAVGNFLFSDGTYGSTIINTITPIGIVYEVTGSTTYPHGYAIALADIDDGNHFSWNNAVLEAVNYKDNVPFSNISNSTGWFLPSSTDLELCNTALSGIGTGYGMYKSGLFYWSSTEDDDEFAHLGCFNEDGTFEDNANNEKDYVIGSVRAAIPF